MTNSRQACGGFLDFCGLKEKSLISLFENQQPIHAVSISGDQASAIF